MNTSTERLLLIPALFTAFGLFAGCDTDSTSPRLQPATDQTATDQTATDQTATGAEAGQTEIVHSEESRDGTEVDLSIPVLEPKPLVWSDARTSSEAVVSTHRKKAEPVHRAGDFLKAMGSYTKAEAKYRHAMEIDPTWAFPSYQLACNYALAGRDELARDAFAKAIKLGFDDFPTALDDDELGSVRNQPEFEQQLLKIRERYLAASKKRVGEPYAVRPSGDPPQDGWPVMMLLHGYGDSHNAYLDNAEKWAELGFVAIAVPGSVPQREGSYIWDLESIEPTVNDLRAILKSPLLDAVINRQQVNLLGFSQGALHAMLVCAKYNDEFQGVIGVSPGGSLARQLISPSIKRSDGKCVFIHGTQEPHAALVDVWKAECEDAGWKFTSATHEGGHHFPRNWDAMRSEYADFLTKR